MKIINSHTSKGKINGTYLVDDEDHKILKDMRWHCIKGYAATLNNKYMHQFILEVPNGMVADHIDRNPLNNLRSNLRIVSRRQNSMNSNSRNGTSKYKGVSWKAGNNKWQAQIYNNGVKHYLGLYSSEDEAALAFNEKAIELQGEYSVLNEVV